MILKNRKKGIWQGFKREKRIRKNVCLYYHLKRNSYKNINKNSF